MSLNKIAASKPKRRTGWSVTSTARSGFWQSWTNVYFSLSLRYSGNARPACRISQIGGRSTGWQRAAWVKRSRAVKAVFGFGNLDSATFIAKIYGHQHNDFPANCSFRSEERGAGRESR